MVSSIIPTRPTTYSNIPTFLGLWDGSTFPGLLADSTFPGM